MNKLNIFHSSQQAWYYELCKNKHQFFKAIDVTPLYGENKVLILNETFSWSSQIWCKQSLFKYITDRKDSIATFCSLHFISNLFHGIKFDYSHANVLTSWQPGYISLLLEPSN